MNLNVKQIAHYTGGTFLLEPFDGKSLVTHVTWDSREVQPGSLFVALPGERVDGHDFLNDIIHKGAAAALVTKRPTDQTMVLAREMGVALIEVPSCQGALNDLASAWRSQCKARVIAVTGSTGKTSCKNLLRDVLSTRFKVVATAANQNNELGVPRTLLNAEADTDFVVVEMGMRGMGQIDSLCRIVNPDMGVITNIGEAHLELLGSRENIARAKGELIAHVPAHKGKVFLNAGNDMFGFLAHLALGKEVPLVAFSGEGEPAFITTGQMAHDVSTIESMKVQPLVWATDVTLNECGCARFTLNVRGIFEDAAPFAVFKAPAEMPLMGIHHVSNACMATAVALSVGMSLDEVVAALAQAKGEAGRQEIKISRAGYTLINDAYNANPDSMRASLASFVAFQPTKRHIAVLGDMGELGENEVACHKSVGAYAATLPLDRLLCVGVLSEHIAQGAIEAGMDTGKIGKLHNVADALEFLESYAMPDDVILVKASHFMGLNRVVEGLMN